MINQNAPDERVVYLALKNVFRGPNAEVRQPKKIRKLINRSASQGDNISHLIESHNIDHVCNAVRVLLTEEVFQSTLKAKMRFPEIFDVSPAQSAERAASVAEAARNDARALKDIVISNPDISRPENPFARSFSIDTAETCRPGLDLQKIASKAKPPLFPAYLPLGAEHRLLSKLQTILESACFRYAQCSMADILTHRSWDCVEAAELHHWMKEFQARIADFGGREQSLGKPVEDVLRSAADIRHAAVHRLHLSARGLENLLLDAESLSTLLGDDDCLNCLSALRRETVAVIEELERNKHILASSFEETKKKLAAQRAELDRLEKEAEVQMANDDREYQMIAGSSLDKAVNIFESRERHIIWEETDPERYYDVAESCDSYWSELDNGK